ncbi:MAG: hypothetical protein HY922_01590 [Elusimicrobia bacterium]|nr:hypothetical protein [Elusimicrobiota bacterium]
MKYGLRLLSFSALAILGGAFIASADAQQAPQPNSGKKYQICLWPNTCGASGAPAAIQAPKQAPAEVPQIKAPLQGAAAFSPDPLQQKIVEKNLLDENGDGVVSAMRVKEGESEERIIYSGDSSLSLPKSKIAKPKSASPAEEKDWNKVDLKTGSADQINGMREERPSLRRGESDSKAGADRMFGSGRKAVRK